MSRYVKRLRGEPTSEKFLAFVVLLTSCGGSGVGRDDESGVSGPLNIGRAPEEPALVEAKPPQGKLASSVGGVA